MELDRLVAEEQRRADLLVRLPLGHLDGDLQLLRRELLGLVPLPTPEPLAAGAQLSPRAIRPRVAPRRSNVSSAARSCSRASTRAPRDGAVRRSRAACGPARRRRRSRGGARAIGGWLSNRPRPRRARRTARRARRRSAEAGAGPEAGERRAGVVDPCEPHVRLDEVWIGDGLTAWTPTSSSQPRSAQVHRGLLEVPERELEDSHHARVEQGTVAEAEPAGDRSTSSQWLRHGSHRRAAPR